MWFGKGVRFGMGLVAGAWEMRLELRGGHGYGLLHGIPEKAKGHAFKWADAGRPDSDGVVPVEVAEGEVQGVDLVEEAEGREAGWVWWLCCLLLLLLLQVGLPDERVCRLRDKFALQPVQRAKPPQPADACQGVVRDGVAAVAGLLRGLGPRRPVWAGLDAQVGRVSVNVFE